MKKVTTYFGNRFKNSLRGISRRSKKQLAAASIAPVTTSEFEALEGRILLSGIGTGLNKKSVSFIDTDGDKVRVTALGKSVTFDIDLGGATNNADIANINLKGNGSLGVVVTPVGSFTRPVVTRPILDPNFGLVNPGPGGSTDYTDVKFESKVQTQYYNLTPGYTNIGSITATGIPQIGSIGLVAAVVPVIDLPGTIVGNINLSTGLVAKVDQIMATNGSYLPGYGGWIPGLGDIDLFAINAKSIAGINISGIPGAGNDFMGDITVVDGIGRLTGTNSTFFGQISLTGPTAILGTVVLGGGFADGAGIVSDGDLTFNAAGFDGVLNVGGHLNLGIRGDDFSGTITASEGISGLRAVKDDPIQISNSTVSGHIFSLGVSKDSLDYTGKIASIFFSNANLTKGVIVAGTSIGDINIGANSTFTNSAIEAPEIGVISSYGGNGLGTGNSIIADNLGGIVIRNANLAAGNLIDVTGKIGTIDIANGNLSASITAGQIGEVILRGNGDGKTGNLTGSLQTTAGDIGSLTLGFGNLTGVVKSAANIGAIDFNGGQLAGTITAIGNIASISADWLGTAAGQAITDTARIDAGGTIGSIMASSVNGDAIGAAVVTVGGSLASISAKSLDGLGINGLTVQALGPITSIAGSGLNGGIFGLYASSAKDIGTVSGNSLLGNGLQQSRLKAQSIGSVVGNSDAGAGIINLEVTTTSGGLGSLTGSGDTGGILDSQLNTATSVGPITGTATGGNFSGPGIGAVKVVAGTSVGAITGTSLSFSALDNGIDGMDVSAGTTIGQISGTATSGSGINEGSFVSVTGGIAGVTGKSIDAGSNGSGIFGAEFISQQGFVGAISGSAAGTGAGIGGALANETKISAQTDIASVSGTSLFGTGINWTNIHSSYGNIGAVTGTSSNDTGTGDGIANTNIDASLGSITSVTGSASGQGGLGGDGLHLVDVFASKGNLTVSGTAHGGFGIFGGDVLLADGDLTVNGSTVTGTAIGGDATATPPVIATFEAALGSVTINVSATGQGANGIDGAQFTGESIGALTVNLTSSQAGNAINNADFTASNGSIGAITVTNNSTTGGTGITNSSWEAVGGDIDGITVTMANTGAGAGIVDSNFAATGDIDFVTVTGTTGSGIVGNSPVGTSFVADTDGDFKGNIGDITVTVTGAGASGILGIGLGFPVFFQGSSIGDITVAVNNAGGGSAISGAVFNATGPATIGNISATTKGTANNAHAIDGSLFTSVGNIGTINATTAGGSAIILSDFNSLDGEIGAITATSTGTSTLSDGIVESGFFAAGNIGAITATTNGGDAIANSDFEANFDGIGTAATAGNLISVTATTNGKNGANSIAIFSSEFSGANIGLVNATATDIDGGHGIFASTFTASVVEPDGKGNFNDIGTIGDITADTAAKIGSGILSSDFFAGAGGSIGDITARTDYGSAIDNSNFAAIREDSDQGKFTSTIGTITVEFGRNNDFTANPAAIVDSIFLANAGISLPDLTIRGIGSGISGSLFNADFDFGGVDDVAGNLGNITVDLNGRNSTGVVDSAFIGANIGNIAVSLQNDAKTSGSAISNGDFTALAGDIGTITVLNKGVEPTSSGITNGSEFSATGNIGAILVTVDAGDGITDSSFNAGGNLSTITVTTNTGTGISGSAFTADNIGIINSKVTGDGGSAISNSDFTATAGNIATITAFTAGTEAGDHAIGGGSTFTATGNIGAISATALAGDGIVLSTFTADSDGDDLGNLSTITVTTATGNGILFSGFEGNNIGAISSKVTGDGGIAIGNSQFTATTGDIGTVFASTLGTEDGDHAVFDNKFKAAGSIGTVTANANGGRGIWGGNFTADSDGDDIGGIGNITATSVSDRAISDVGFTGASIGNIAATVSGADGNEGIWFSNFTATAGNIGTVNVINAGSGPDAAAMKGANFEATGNIGFIQTQSIDSGILSSTFRADSDDNGTGDIAGLSVLVTGGNGALGIQGSSFIAANIPGLLGGNAVNVVLTDTKAGTAIDDSFFQALNGNIGSINVNNKGEEPGSSGITNGSSFSATGNIGTITVAVDGGNGITGSSFIADSDGDLNGDLALGGISVTTNNGYGIDGGTFRGVNIGNINVAVLGVDGNDAIDNSNFTATGGNIGTITATTAGVGADAIDDSNFLATNNIGAVNASSTNADGDDGIDESVFTADSDGDLVGNLGNITASSVNSDGILDSTFSGANIGNVIATVSGVTGDDAMDNANFTATAGSIGTITATSAGENETNRGILDSTFLATEGIGLVTSTSVGSGIVGSFFQANTDADETGDLARVNVLVTGGNGANGIIGSNFLGANIGAGGNAISVTLLNTKAGTAILQSNFAVSAFVETTPGKFDSTGVIGSIFVDNFSLTGNGIDNSSFKAGAAGSIGNITVFNDGDIAITAAKFDADLTSAGQTLFTSTIGQVSVFAITNAGIAGSGFTAYNGIGLVTVNSVGNAIALSNFDANLDANNTGDIAGITVNVSGAGNGIADSNFTGANLGDITVNINDATGKAGISKSNFTANSLTIVTAGVEENNDGTIGKILVTNASLTGDGIFDSIFQAGAAGSIGSITVENAGDNAINGSDFLATTTTITQTVFTSTIGAILVEAGNDGINGDTIAPEGKSFFTSYAGIGTITVNSVDDGIDDTEFNANFDNNDTGNIGDITVTVSGGGTGIADSDFTGANLGNIEVQILDADGEIGIRDSNFTANSLTIVTAGVEENNDGTIGDITVNSASDNAGKYNAVQDSNFLAGSAGGIGNIEISLAGQGTAVQNSEFAAYVYGPSQLAYTSTMGDVTVTSGGRGINASYFAAEEGIGAIDVQTVGDGILQTEIDSWASGNTAGGITSINVEASGENARGIAEDSFIDATEILGGITVRSTNTLGGDAFQNSSINVEQDAKIGATGNVGAMLFETAGGYDLATKAGQLAHAISLDAGYDISVGGDATSFEANVTSVTGGSAVVGDFAGGKAAQIIVVGDLGSIDITNDSAELFAHGMDDIKFNVGGTLGPVTITVAGGSAMFGSVIDPTSIKSVTLTTTGVDPVSGKGSTVMLGSSIVTTIFDTTDPLQTGDIGPVLLTTSNGGLGMAGSQIIAAGDITSLKSNGGLALSTIQIGRDGILSALEVSVTEGDALSNVTVTYAGQGSPVGTAATASIGTIDITNTSQQLGDDGIAGSYFFAGSTGTGIGEINVTVDGGAAITGSVFNAVTGSFIPNNTDVTDQGTFVTPLSAYSANPNTNGGTFLSTAAPLPTGFTGDIGFSVTLDHTRVDGNGGFPAWDGGSIWGDTASGNLYDGDVYVTGAGDNSSATLDFTPAPSDSSIGSVIFYVLGTTAGQDFEILLPGGERLIIENVQFATAVEVTATDAVLTGLSTIKITTGTYDPTDPNPLTNFVAAGDFGVGQFSVALAAAPAADTADIGPINATSDGVFTSSSGIVNSKFIAADSIGDITVNAGNNPGFPFTASGGDGINNGQFTAVGGNIGLVTVTNTSTDIGLTTGDSSEGITGSSQFTAKGDIDAISVTVAGGNGINNSGFTATDGTIDSITVANTGAPVAGGDSYGNANGGLSGIVDSNFSAGTDIGIIDASTLGTHDGSGATQSDGIRNSSFTAGGSIDNIIASTDGDDGIQDGTFTAQDGNIGTVDATSNNVAGVYNDAIVDSTFTATGDINDITAIAGSGCGIDDSTFTADSDTGLVGDIGNITSTSTYGDAIVYSDLSGANIGNIEAKVTGDGNDGIAYSTFTSTGNIGDINVQSNGTSPYSDYGIVSSTFTANGNIGLTNGIIVTTVGGGGIAYSTFKADSDSASGGDIGAVDVTTAESDAIYDSSFSAVNIGDISAVHTGTGSGGGDGIDDSSFIATGNIGNINASTAGTFSDDGAIENSTFDAKGNIGNLTATAVADHTVDFSAGGGIFADGNIGNITVSMTGTTGAFDAILGSGKATTVIEAKGNLGDITITNDSTDANADGLDNVKIDVTGTLGTVTITAAGGAAMNASSIDPTSIGAITLSGASAAMTKNSEIVTSGAIASLTVTGAIEAGSKISAASITGATSVTGDLAGSIDTTGSIGAVTVSTLSGSIFNAGTTTGAISIGTAAGGSINAVTSIGNITITGTGDQSLTIKAPTVGNITASSLADTKTATLTIDGSVLTIGNISVAAPTGTANLITKRDGVTPFNQLSTLGNVTVDGNWDNNNSLVLLTQIGNVSVGGGIGGGSFLGDATNGMKITSANSGTVSVGGVTPGVGNAVTFNVVTGYTGTFTIDGTPYTNQATAPYNGTPVDGLTVNLV